MENMASSKDLPLQISGFYILPISLPALPSFPTPATHYLYIINHQPKVPTATATRSLFLVNVPFDATENHIKHLLSVQIQLPVGRIEAVQFEGEGQKAKDSSHKQSNVAKKGKKRKRVEENENIEDIEGASLPSTWDRELKGIGRTAIVILVDRASMEAVIRAVKKTRKDGKDPVWGEGSDSMSPNLGSSRYLNHLRLRYPDKAQLLQSVNTYMTAFAAREDAQATLLARKRQEPDEDGFVTVTRGGRNGPARQELAQIQAENHKARQKGLEDFYRFQTREKRKAQAGELRRKFEEDRETVRKMKENRGNSRPE